ncbi:MAG: ABC-ATPase UvrA, partial [Clostridia bacterium]|nr:ABC-ATPase UvrA [Clostridia bacterium]
IGIPHCPTCGKEIVKQTVAQIADKIVSYPVGSKIRIIAPVVRGRKGEFVKQLESMRRSGYMRMIIDGIEYDDGGAEVDLDKNYKHTISVIVDRLVIKEGVVRRLTDSLEAALKLGNGLVESECEGDRTLYSTKYSCPDCDISMEELTPRFFSFNSPFGACPHCSGLGFRQVPDTNKFVKWDKSLADGAVDIKGWSFDTCKINAAMTKALAQKYKFSLDVPFKDLPKKIQDIVLYGDNEPLNADMRGVFNNGFYSKVYEGVYNIILRRYAETTSELTKMELERFMSPEPCNVCHGKRLKKEALGVTVGGKNIIELCDMSIGLLPKFFDELQLSPTQTMI